MIQYHITPQFKTNTLFQSYRFQLDKNNRSEVALLARLFQYGTDVYPSKRALKQQLEKLYNVQFATGVEKDGTALILTFTLIFPEYRFVENTEALNDVIHLFKSVVEHPYFMNTDDFSKEFDQEKQQLIEQVKSIYDDKTQYAFTKLQTKVLKDTPFFEDITGTEAMIEKVQFADVKNCWEMIQSDSQIDIYMTTVKEETAKALEMAFSSSAENQSVESLPITYNKNQPFSEVEVQEVTQAKINFAFKNASVMNQQNYFSNIIATSILGGGAQSKLFQNVREKYSLAYYANAIADSASGLMYIYSGVNTDKIEEASTCIFDQLKAMESGQVSEEELDLTKKIMVNGLKESMNRPMGIIQFDRKLKKHPDVEDFDAYIHEIENVTKEDVVQIAKGWELCGSFILKGEGGDGSKKI